MKMYMSTRIAPCPKCSGEIKYPHVAFPKNIIPCCKCGGEFTVEQLHDWSVRSPSELVNPDGKCHHCQKPIEVTLANKAARHYVCHICECGAFYGRRISSPDWYYEGRLKAGSTTTNPDPQVDPWPEERVDIIGQNGNNGEHYAEQQPPAVTTFVCPECGHLTTIPSPEYTGINCHGCGANYLRDDNGVWQRQVKRAQQPLPVGHLRVTSTAPVDDGPLPEYVLKDPGGYTELASMLQAAFNQAAYGKGAERHANDKPFVEQPILKLCQMYGTGFAFGQAGKKMEEAQRMDKDAAVRELLGAIVYIAAAAIHIEQGGDDA